MKAYTKYSMTIAKEKLEKNFLNNLQSLFLKDDSILRCCNRTVQGSGYDVDTEIFSGGKIHGLF